MRGRRRSGEVGMWSGERTRIFLLFDGWGLSGIRIGINE